MVDLRVGFPVAFPRQRIAVFSRARIDWLGDRVFIAALHGARRHRARHRSPDLRSARFAGWRPAFAWRRSPRQGRLSASAAGPEKTGYRIDSAKRPTGLDGRPG